MKNNNNNNNCIYFELYISAISKCGRAGKVIKHERNLKSHQGQYAVLKNREEKHVLHKCEFHASFWAIWLPHCESQLLFPQQQQQHHQQWLWSSLSVTLSAKCCLTNEIQNVESNYLQDNIWCTGQRSHQATRCWATLLRRSLPLKS